MNPTEVGELLPRVREIALSFPGAQEKLSHGSPTWFTKKVFAMYGAHVKGDHDSDLLDHSVVFMPDTDEREALLQDGRFHVPGYWGPFGWLALNLTDGDVDWDEVTELIDASYRNTAGVRLIQQLDSR
ncbi:MmcQ/YjbR family DNA-binding protein [Enemella sp. A6]|uniref:MmcQ/YjbR family DNA-binding protein n=1 Tax=Enemella sp. A6 TaxID=3440152 RepID=UPI003EBE2540